MQQLLKSPEMLVEIYIAAAAAANTI